MIYKKDLLSKIESIESQLERFRGTNFDENIKELDRVISAIVEYLGCELVTEKEIKTPGYNAVGFGGKEYFFVTGKDYIKYTKKLVKKTKATKVATNKKNK